jgi:putative peptide zinc metalloprotease protein
MSGLPPLRQEIRIDRGAALVNGAPSWTLFDPVRHSFYQLGRIEFQIFSHWAQGRLGKLGEALAAEGVPEDQMDAELARVLEFSLAHNLTQKPFGDTVATFTAERVRQRKAWWKWMVDNYLFFRIPLVRPAAFLERTVNRVAPIYTAKALWGFVALAILGLYLVSRQWDAFMVSFLYFFSWQGLIAYGFGLSLVKIIHELGHAYTATRYGVRVPSMGVSFLVMFPVLYTDVTGAWQLRSRRQRLTIDCAGVSAELMVATISTLIWVLLPEGSVRSVFFVLATSSWIMSLAINLNPFMRFDGYYVLSDLLDVPNLQSRGFALGRWKMRELLFGLGDDAPEAVPQKLRRGMILYAWGTWIYRLLLFIGIALLVYYMFFKALGIILFVVEIGVFVARPLFAELKIWWARRSEIVASKRGRWLIGGMLGSLLLVCLPLDRHVSAPAILAPEKASPLIAGDPAKIERIYIKNGMQVKAGQALFELAAPDLEADKGQRATRIKALEERLARAGADGKDLADRSVLEGELQAERAGASGVERRRARLIIHAPHDGVVTDLAADLHSGRFVSGNQLLAHLVSPTRYDVQAYVAEGDVWRISDKALAKFVPNDPVRGARLARLEERGAAAVQRLDLPMLASIHGGPIAVNKDAGDALRPRSALYRLRFATQPVAAGSPLIQPQAGEVEIDAQSQSLMGQWLRKLTYVLRQEASLR